MGLVEWVINYNNKKIIDVKKELTEEEIKIAKKMGVTVQDKIYTELEYDELKENLCLYYAENSCEENLKYFRPSQYWIKNDDFDKIFNKFNEIDKKYEKLFNRIEVKYNMQRTIEYSQRQIIRDNFIKILEYSKLNNEQKQLVFEIIMNINDVIQIQKERFFIYYGLDLEKERIHNFTKISKMQNCSPSAVRQGICAVKRKILNLPTKEMILLEKIVENHN